MLGRRIHPLSNVGKVLFSFPTKLIWQTIMNWPRYEFSKESETELLEFFRAVAEQKTSATSDHFQLWRTLLPMQDELQQKINSIKLATACEVIDISDSDDEGIDKAAPKARGKMGDFEELLENTSRLSATVNESLIDSLQELLEIESVLSEQIIKQLGSGICQQELKDMFVQFATDLNCECTLKLWKSITSVDCVERNVVGSYFSRYIMLEKILKEPNTSMATLLVEVIATFPNELIVIVQKLLQTTDTTELTILRNNLNGLPDGCKNILLGSFVNHCHELESQHFGIVLSLLTLQMDGEDLHRLVQLMFKIASHFVSEKTFGKLLLQLVHSLGADVVQSEAQLRNMVSMNRSAYKTQIAKGFDRYLQGVK